MDSTLLPQVLAIDYSTYECTNTTQYNIGVVTADPSCWNSASNASVDNL